MTATITVDRERLRRTTALHLLCERARATPDLVAFRSKQFGVYRERRWRDYATLVARYASALQSLGLARGERAAIMGDVCEEWMLCDLAAQSLGAISYGIYPTASPAEVDYQMRDGGASIFIAKNQEYVDKILSIAGRLPDLRAIVVIDDSAMFGYAHPKLQRLRKLINNGDKPDLEWLEARTAALSPEDPAFIVYTSGTTGYPKGALLGHDVAITLPLISQLVPHFGEDREDFAIALFEVAPTVMFTVPRYLQKSASHILVSVLNSSRFKRAAYDAAIRVARDHARRRWDSSTTAAREALYGVLQALIFRPILNKLGFDKLELVVSGGAGLPAETAALWHMYGVNVVEMYGQTE